MAHLGHYISGVGHVGLIGFVLAGPLFTSEPLPFESVSVSVVTASEFAALTAQPQPVALPEAPVLPDLPGETAPDTPAAPPDAPLREDAPAAPPAPDPEAAVPAPPPPPARIATPQTDAPSLVAPAAPEPPATPDAPNVSEQPRQRPSDRIAPTPVAPPAPDAAIAQETRPAIAPDPADAPEDRAQQSDPQEATAPEEAASEIVTEAEEAPPAAPERSLRPQLRPERFAAAAPEDPAPQEPVQPERTDPAPAEPETPPSRSDTTASAIEDVLRQTLADAEAPAPAPAGPPLSAGEREGFVLAVQACWIIDPGSPAAEVVVTVAMSLSPDGRVQGDVRRVSAQGGDARAQDVAFQAARRAVLRCEAGGFPLPPEKYAQWQEVEMTFNPEQMRIR